MPEMYTYLNGHLSLGANSLPVWDDGVELKDWANTFCKSECQSFYPVYGVGVSFYDIDFDHPNWKPGLGGVVAFVEPVFECGFVVHISRRGDLIKFMADIEPMLRIGKMMRDTTNEKVR